MYKDGSCNIQDTLGDMFHGGMDKSVKESYGFMDCQLKVVCATAAYGIGVSISAIDVVVLWGVTKTRLALWQERGRAASGPESRNGNHIPVRVHIGRCGSSKVVNEALAAACIRRGILSNFVLSGEDLPTQVPCQIKCSKAPCTCAFCMLLVLARNYAAVSIARIH